MNKTITTETKKFLSQVDIYGKNLLPELMTDKEYFSITPFLRVLGLRDYIFARMINEIPPGHRKARQAKYKEIAEDYDLNCETLKKIVCKYNRELKRILKQEFLNNKNYGKHKRLYNRKQNP